MTAGDGSLILTPTKGRLGPLSFPNAYHRFIDDIHTALIPGTCNLRGSLSSLAMLHTQTVLRAPLNRAMSA